MPSWKFYIDQILRREAILDAGKGADLKGVDEWRTKSPANELIVLDEQEIRRK